MSQFQKDREPVGKPGTVSTPEYARTPSVKRSKDEMDPESPINTVVLRDLLHETMGPVQNELASIRNFMLNTNKKLDTIAKLQEQIVSLNKENESLKGKLADLESKVESLSNQPPSSESEIRKLRDENRLLSEKILANECQSRRDNLVFIGIGESKGENCEENILAILEFAGFQLDSRSLVRAHRLGPYNKHKTRPVIVRFHHFRDRESVWMGRRFIKEMCDIVVAEDFPEEIRERRKQLYPVLNAAINYRDAEFPDYRFRARLNVDKLVINGASYSVDTLHKLPHKLKPEYSSSPSKDDKLIFFTKSSPLSNHYPSTFTVSGFQYSSMEQYLMEAKALFFDDQDTAAEIMIRQDPVHQKRLGKSVKNFDLSTWQDAVPAILETGLMAKFSQVDHCKDFLLSTEGKTLGEANANDSFFGIGMGLRHPDVWDMDLWGKNLLGQMLMKVRDSLS